MGVLMWLDGLLRGVKAVEREVEVAVVIQARP